MSVASIFDRFVFPMLDALLVGPLRHPCTQFSAAVRELTGYWVHPGWWPVDAVLFSALALLLWLKSRRGRCPAGQ